MTTVPESTVTPRPPGDQPPDDAAVRIGIAVVMAAGHVLTGTRAAGQTFSGLAEFPGGKCQPEETASRCAVRECREETGLKVTVERELCRQAGRAGNQQLDLTFLQCRLTSAAETPAELPDPAAGFRWTRLEQLEQLQFPPANAEVVAMLSPRRPPSYRDRTAPPTH